MDGRIVLKNLNPADFIGIEGIKKNALMHRLYHHPLCPFSRFVRLTLAEKRIEVDLVEERYWEKSSEFLKLNPLGQVPVLRSNGRVFGQSAAICEYLEERYPEPNLVPKDAEACAEMRRLVGWFNDSFNVEVTQNLLGERILRKLQGGGYPDSAKVKEGVKRIKFHQDYLASLLDSRKWLAGNQMTLADFAAAAHISCIDYISDFDWNRHASIKDWYAILKSRPAFRSILSDHIPGFPPPPHYTDLDF